MNTQEQLLDAEDMFHDEPQGLGEHYQAPAPDAGKPAGTMMSADVKAKGKARDLTKKPLVTIDPEEYVTQVFAPFNEDLDTAIAKSAATDYDVTTTAGMKLASERRRIFRAIRTASENARKERKAPILQIGKLLDSRQKEIEAKALPYEEAHDKIIKAEEARKEAIRQEEIRIEQERVNNITAKIEKIAALPADFANACSDAIRQAYVYWDGRAGDDPAVDQEEFAEFFDQAREAMINAAKRLHGMLVAAEERERRQAEEVAARQREKEERARIEAALAEERRKAAALEAAQAEERQLAAERLAEEQRRAAAERKQTEERMAEERREVEVRKQAMAEKIAELQRQLAAAQAKPEEEPELVEEIAPESPAVIDLVSPAVTVHAEMAWPEPFPAVVQKPAKYPAPSAADIVAGVASHFQVDEATARSWLCIYDFAAISKPAPAASAAA